MKVTKLSHVSYRLDVPFIRGERWLMFRSDVHTDHPCSDAALEREHLDLAVKRNAAIIDGGDLFDAMQGFHDRRASKGTTKQEHDAEDYYDRIVRTTGQHLSRYADNFAIFMHGNHETAVAKHANTDLTVRLVEHLRGCGSPALAAGYRGYVRLCFGGGLSALIYVVHGSRSNAPVTRGVISASRRANYIRDADIVFSGDSHDGWMMPVVRETMTNGKRETHTQWHLQCPSYKDVLASRDLGYEIEREFAPKPKGCWFLRFYRRDGKLGIDLEGKFSS